MVVSNVQQWLKPWLAAAPALSILDIATDSREVQPGWAFIAVKGATGDGRDYINTAIANGAVLILRQAPTWAVTAQAGIHFIDFPNLDAEVSHLAKAFYANPDEQLTLVGVTGTNGKSTISHLVAQWASLLGTPSAVIGTLGWGEPNRLLPLRNTTPGPVELFRLLAQCVAEGKKLVAMEVSSHALVQQRVAAVTFAARVFSNLTRDHLDYHGSMDAYGEAKALLFEHYAGVRVINADDATGRAWLSRWPDAQRFGHAEDCDVRISNWQAQDYANQLTLQYQGHVYQAQTQLMGDFNASNLAAAFTCLVNLGFAPAPLMACLAQLTAVCGRMEPVATVRGVQALVDYAHTPDALVQAIHALSQSRPLWVVFGCGGDRDAGKRPLMAAACADVDYVIITDDNPRSEDPQVISAQVASGMTHSRYQIINDRAQAIYFALSQAPAGATVLIAGKGHESGQIVAGKVLPFSDQQQILAVKEQLDA